jgi:predicted dehydrogenase
MARGSFHVPRRIVVSEGRLKSAGVLKANQLPAHFAAVPAPCGTGQKSHDDVLAQSFEEFGVLNGGDGTGGARGSKARPVEFALVLVEGGQSAVDEVDYAGLFGAGAIVRWNDLRRQGFDLGGGRRVKILQLAAAGLRRFVRMLQRFEHFGGETGQQRSPQQVTPGECSKRPFHVAGIINPMEQHRRGFLKSAGAAAFTTSLFTGNIRGANDRVNIAFIGVGRMGSSNLGFAGKTPGVNVSAVCDVYQPALESAAAQAKKLGFAGVKPVKDFREVLADKSIDAVCIATPDHWHAYITVEACKAGKDVWVEKPACVYVEEGVQMVEAARKYRRVVQAGTMQRSGGFFRKAREIVKSGELGDVTFCRAFQSGADKKEGYGNPPDSDPPPGLDWDMWLGPAPKRPFNANRWGVAPGRWSTFRYFWDYAGGAMTDWGVHLLDIVQFAFDEAMPLSVAAQGGKFFMTDNLETPGTMQATYRYPGFVGSYESRTVNPYLLYNGNNGIAFHGTKATLMVNRSGYWLYPNDKNAKPVEETSRELADMNMPHWANFLECIRSRQKPTSDIETCVRSTTTCLLANLAYRHSTALDWDDKNFTVKRKDVRPFLKAEYRAPWRLEV